MLTGLFRLYKLFVKINMFNGCVSVGVVPELPVKGIGSLF